MAKQSGRIAPITKSYGDEVLTLDQQLAKNGYNRFPGTIEMLLPYKEKSGRYRTGLDENAAYLNRLSEEDKQAEILRIQADKKRIETELGVPGILDSNSLFYNFAATEDALVARFGTELQVTPVKLGDKEEVFNWRDNIMTEIAWNWIRVHPRIAPSIDAFRQGKVPSDVKYYLVDSEAEVRADYNKKREINKAISAFDALTPTKKKQIGRLMGLPIVEETTEETVYNLVDTELKNTEFKSGKHKGSSTIRLFNELLKMTDDRLRIKDLIEQSLMTNIYRVGQGGKIIEGTLTIATSQDDLVEFLLDDKNQMDVIALENKLKGKKLENL